MFLLLLLLSLAHSGVFLLCSLHQSHLYPHLLPACRLILELVVIQIVVLFLILYRFQPFVLIFVQGPAGNSRSGISVEVITGGEA